MEFPAKASVCIVGAGAIGGLLGVHLSQRGHGVTFLARGAHLSAMQAADALKVIKQDGSEVCSAAGSKFVASLDDVGIQDIVVLGLKMHQIKAVLPKLPRVVGPNTIILTAQNGVPWWYFQMFPGPPEFKNRVVESVDPGGVLMSSIDASKIIASVVFAAASVSSPGVITHVGGIRFPVGELNGETTERIKWLSSVLIDAGFVSPAIHDIRAELWLKLWLVAAMGPLTALTHATVGVMCTEKAGRDVVIRVMAEVERVAEKLGSGMRLPAQSRIDMAAKNSGHRTSMLQDVEAGREMEIDSIIGSVVELARICGEDTPCVDTIFGTLQMLGHVMRSERAKICMVKVGDGECRK